MNSFMSNDCNHPNCMRDNCKGCRYYSPEFYGIPVPIKLGDLLYKLQEFLLKKGVIK